MFNGVVICIGSTEFKPEDSVFVNKQLAYDRKYEFKIDTLNYSEISFLSHDTLKAWEYGGMYNYDFWKTYHKNVKQCFCAIGCPIYNNDKSLAIIISSHVCGGCWIEWFEVLFKRTGKEW